RANPAKVALPTMARAPWALPGQALAASRPPRVPARTKGHPMPERAGRHQAGEKANLARVGLLGMARAPWALPGQALAASRPPRVPALARGRRVPGRAGRHQAANPARAALLGKAQARRALPGQAGATVRH